MNKRALLGILVLFQMGGGVSLHWEDEVGTWMLQVVLGVCMQRTTT